MDSNILSFCNDIQKYKNGEDIKIGVGKMGTFHDYVYLKLDDEDIEYLFNKYSKKLSDEMNVQIKEIQDKYNSVKTN